MNYKKSFEEVVMQKYNSAMEFANENINETFVSEKGKAEVVADWTVDDVGDVVREFLRERGL